MKRIKAAMLFVGLAVTCLVACGGKDTDALGTTPEATVAPQVDDASLQTAIILKN